MATPAAASGRAGISTRFPRPSLPVASENFRLSEIRHEIQFFSFVHDRVAAASRSHARLIQREPFAVFQKSRLQKSGGKNLELVPRWS